MKRLKWTMISIFSLGFLIMNLQEHGFCVKKMAFLQDIYTEEQLIDKAILFSMKRMPGTMHYSDGRASEKLHIYSNLTEFKQFNPDCCQLSEKGPENYTNPAYIGYIIVEYIIFYHNMRKEGTYGYYIAYDSCGNLYDRYIY